MLGVGVTVPYRTGLRAEQAVEATTARSLREAAGCSHSAAFAARTRAPTTPTRRSAQSPPARTASKTPRQGLAAEVG
eukprot:2360474-Prymnesium_polylepis.1